MSAAPNHPNAARANLAVDPPDWRASNRLTARFHARFSSALARIDLRVDQDIPTGGIDDVAWARRQSAAATFLEETVSDHRWLRGIDGSAGALATIACQHAGFSSQAPLLITTGLGGSEQLPSHRLIQAIDPPLALARRLRAAGIPGLQVRLFKADAVASIVNRFDPSKMADVSVLTLAYIKSYVRMIYPELVPFVSVTTDRPDAVHALVDRVVRPLSAGMGVRSELAALGRHRSSPADSMVYGLCHGFHMGALLPSEGGWSGLWADDAFAPQPASVFCVGGRPEQHFVPVMNLAAAMAGKGWRKPLRTHLITRLGQKPAYLPLAHEASILQPLSHSDLETGASDSILGPDWRAMLADRRLPELLAFANAWRG